MRTEGDKRPCLGWVAELAMAEEAAERASRRAQEALQAAKAIAAAKARAEAERAARSRWRRLGDAWQGQGRHPIRGERGTEMPGAQ